MEQPKITLKLVESLVFDKEKMDLLMNEVSKNIFRERVKRNLSMHQLADLTGINYSHIYKISNCKTRVGLPALIKIAYALDASLDELVPFETGKHKSNGDIFNEITKELDVASINFLLDTARKYREYKVKNSNMTRKF